MRVTRMLGMSTFVMLVRDWEWFRERWMTDGGACGDVKGWSMSSLLHRVGQHENERRLGEHRSEATREDCRVRDWRNATRSSATVGRYDESNQLGAHRIRRQAGRFSRKDHQGERTNDGTYSTYK